MRIIILIILSLFIGCTVQFDAPSKKTVENTNESIETISYSTRCLDGHVVYYQTFIYSQLIEHKLDNTGKPIKCN